MSEPLPLVPQGVVVVRYHDAPKNRDLYAFRDAECGDLLCWRCRRSLADDASQEPERPIGRLDVEPYGHVVVICPGCRVGGES